MGAFLIQGLVPGPAMLTPAPKGHLAVTFAMVWTIVVSNAITVLFCLFFMSQLARVTQIRGTLLVPFILTLIYVGAFAEKNVFQDLGIVLVFGLLGWIMARLSWPRPPLLLGLVLGPLAENKLFLSTDNYGAAWLLRPGVLVMLAIIAAGLLTPLWNARRRRRRAPPMIVVGPEPTTTAPAGLRLDAATAFSAGIVLLFALALWRSRDFGLRAGLFPWAIGIPTLGLAIVQLARDATGRRSGMAMDAAAAYTDLAPDVAARRTLAIWGWIAGGFVAIWLLGFSAGTLATTVLYLAAGARERWPVTVALALLGLAFVHGLFERGLGVPFPPGQLGVWLGYGE
jgi:TctA family transporter